MAGIKDVAREAGVSASTVSYVLSGKRSISAKTTGKVMAAVEKLGYTPDASARKMRGMRKPDHRVERPDSRRHQPGQVQRLLPAHRMGRKECRV